MKHDLTIRRHNIQAHLDIEKDIQARKDGLFTFILRVNGGNIVDYVIMEQSDGSRYRSLTQVVVKKPASAYNN